MDLVLPSKVPTSSHVIWAGSSAKKREPVPEPLKPGCHLARGGKVICEHAPREGRAPKEGRCDGVMGSSCRPLI